MFIGYVAVAVVAAAMNVWAASLDFRRAEMAVANAGKVEVPPSWLLPLGALKVAGAIGLIVGIAVPLIGVAAAIGLVLFFVCAVFAHLRVGWYSTLPFPIAFLLFAVVALVLRLAMAGNLWDLSPHL
ncbi:DoxX-like family protein [Micromonospora viridifaciens]|uniref:DoxX-like family protein n=1 Tax=Micromonospora viridifaciens TaxID=1881 RepID=A0A1C4XLQ6_MICVI|nr:DoxX family protein [Micromonospora viridifaciens]SCF09387.1 DoxX-like family protein [Micromonospora viridifaciens]